MKSENVLGVVLIIVILVFAGLLIYGTIDTHNQNVQTCEYNGNTLNTTSRYYNGTCQLLSQNGVWIDEQQYLLLAATNKCP